MAHFTRPSMPVRNCFDIPGTDLMVQIELIEDELTMTVSKAQTAVYRVILENAAKPIENAWLAEMFMREDRVQLDELSADVSDYVDTLNISQG